MAVNSWILLFFPVWKNAFSMFIHIFPQISDIISLRTIADFMGLLTGVYSFWCRINSCRQQPV